MKEELKKSLTDLIDETLLELEELKKSRFSPAEVDLKGPGADGIAGKSANGKLAEKAEDKDDEDEDKDMDKGEGVNSPADPNAGHHKMDKGEGVNSPADPNAGKHKMDKAEDKKDDDKEDKKDEPHKDDPKHEEKEKDMAKKLLDMHKGEMKKSLEEADALMKSYVDQKVSALEGKLATILETVTKLADAPVPAKGVSYKGAAPLLKSADDVEPLSKSEVASKLFDLKKSGSRVDSNDIAMAEMGHDLEKIVSKYNIK